MVHEDLLYDWLEDADNQSNYIEWVIQTKPDLVFDVMYDHLIGNQKIFPEDYVEFTENQILQESIDAQEARYDRDREDKFSE